RLRELLSHGRSPDQRRAGRAGSASGPADVQVDDAGPNADTDADQRGEDEEGQEAGGDLLPETAVRAPGRSDDEEPVRHERDGAREPERDLGVREVRHEGHILTHGRDGAQSRPAAPPRASGAKRLDERRRPVAQPRSSTMSARSSRSAAAASATERSANTPNTVGPEPLTAAAIAARSRSALRVPAISGRNAIAAPSRSFSILDASCSSGSPASARIPFGSSSSRTEPIRSASA